MGNSTNILTSEIPDYERHRIIEDFRKERFSVLISTHWFPRGIHVPDIDLAINFDIPVISVPGGGYIEPDFVNYLHKVGKASTFKADGIAITFYANETKENIMGKIEKKWETPIEEIKSFEAFREIFSKMRPWMNNSFGINL